MFTQTAGSHRCPIPPFPCMPACLSQLVMLFLLQLCICVGMTNADIASCTHINMQLCPGIWNAR